MPTAAIYTRVSSEDQVSGTSLATQEEACRAWCDRNGHTVAAVFSDAGETAKTSDRPQFIALLAWCAKSRPDIVLVWKFDRWARRTTDHAAAVATLEKYGCRLVSATEAVADDPAGRLLQTILAGIAQFDNEVRAERAKAAMRAVALRGGWVTYAPFGFMLSRSGTLPILVEHPERAPLVRELFSDLASGRKTLRQVLEHATVHGIPEKRARSILASSVYAGVLRGDLTGGKEITAAFPGIVSRDVWIAVQRVLSGKTYGAYRALRDEFPLRGLLRCDVCGRPVSAAFSRGHGGRYGYYACKAAGHVRARVEVVHRSWIRLLDASQKRILPRFKAIREQVRAVIEERMDAVRAVERDSAQEVERLRQRRARLLDAYLGGAILKDDFATRDAELHTRITEAESVSRCKTDWGLDSETAVAKVVQMLDDPGALWERMALGQRRKFAVAMYGVDLRLTASGECRTDASHGLAGSLRCLSAPDGELAYLGDGWANFSAAIRAVIEAAA